MNLLNQIVLILVIVLSLILGLWVFLANKKTRTAKSFLFVSICIIFWILFSFLGSSNLDNSLIWYRLNFAVVSITFIAFYFLAENFPIESNENKNIKWFIVLPGIFFAIVSAFTNFIINSTSTISANQLSINTGTLGYPFYAYIGIFAGLILFNFFKKFFNSNKEEKSRIVLFLVGLLLYAAFNIVFNFILPMLLKGRFVYYQFGDYSAIFFLGFTAYAILKRGLFNIKVIATETTVVALSIGLLIEVFLSNTLIEGLLKGIVFVLATYGGYILVKSVKKEIAQREQIEKLAKKLDEANKHLEELDEAKDNFLSMAAHELNTPIAAIEGYLSMIIDEKMAGEINPKLMGYLENIYGSSKRLAGLVKDLLNVSRIESNRIHLIYEQVQIEDLINQSISEIKIKADEVGHKLSFEKPDQKLPKTWLDKDRITEVVINIIGNAIKYTEPPGKIVVKAHADNNKIIVSIEDNGRGIPKERQNHIFEKFAQGDVLKDQVKGTGLGMFISKNLIELHKGKIWFKSHTGEDHGTIFYFSVPILDKKPFDPYEGEGALFAVGKPKAKAKPGTEPPIAAIAEVKKSNENKPEVPTLDKEIKKGERLHTEMPN